jgi:hypothetical protein
MLPAVPQEGEGGPDERHRKGACRAMSTMAGNVLRGMALFVLVVALMLVALVLLIPDLSWANVFGFLTMQPDSPCACVFSSGE